MEREIPSNVSTIQSRNVSLPSRLPQYRYSEATCQDFRRKMVLVARLPMHRPLKLFRNAITLSHFKALWSQRWNFRHPLIVEFSQHRKCEIWQPKWKLNWWCRSWQRTMAESYWRVLSTFWKWKYKAEIEIKNPNQGWTKFVFD